MFELNTKRESHMTQEADEVLETLAYYICNFQVTSDEAYSTALLCLADSLGCAVLSLCFPECTRLLGPIVAGTSVPHGSRVPGTDYILDPITAAFNIGSMIRWLDFNDTWLAAEWGHPSDNIGGVLAVADYLSRKNLKEGKPSITMLQLLTAIIKAYEIQGCLALNNSYNRIGLDHVIFVKIATAGITAEMLGANHQQIIYAMSQAWLDNAPLRTYRHGTSTGSRKSWAAGDATSRGVLFAWLTLLGEPGYPHALTSPSWGINDVLFKSQPISLIQPLETYVVENILFKVSYPAEFHAQTAVECAIKLHPQVRSRLDEIRSISIYTQESSIRIIDKKGDLKNPADRDHCIQYMVAVGLLNGELKAEHYNDGTANDSRIDLLRSKMKVFENEQFSKDYLDPMLRSIANSIHVEFSDGSKLDPVTIEFPLGHRNRREEAQSLILSKCENNLKTCFPKERVAAILQLFCDRDRFESRPVALFCDLFHK